MPTKPKTAPPKPTVQADGPGVTARKELGAAARMVLPRGAHGAFQPANDRADPVDILEAQATSRVEELVPVRYGRMLLSPFTFYRGAAAIMAADLASAPSTTITTQLCGDAHLSNFGIFASPERSAVFDINDFDETYPGPFEWDVKRLVASFAIAGRNNRLSRTARAALVTAVVRQYREAMLRFSTMPEIDIWYTHATEQQVIDAVRQVNEKVAKRTQGVFAKAQTRDSHQALTKLTSVVDGRRRILSQPPLLVPAEELPAGAQAVEQVVHETLGTYAATLSAERARLLSKYEYVHAGRKVVGVGSVGTRAYIILMQGRDENDILLLQVKEAQKSVLDGFAGASTYDSQGERVVIGQRLMQAVSDTFLGWYKPGPESLLQQDYYLRQLRDWKGSAEVELMRPEGLAVYGRLCGWTLARAHARAGDPIAIAAYLGNKDDFDRAMVGFAEAYADQNERDYGKLVAAADSGRVKVIRGI